MYEQKLGYYLASMKEHFEVCRKCENLEEKISQLTPIVGTDKKAAKSYKVAEGKQRLNSNIFYSEKFQKLIVRKGSSLQDYLKKHVRG